MIPSWLCSLVVISNMAPPSPGTMVYSTSAFLPMSKSWAFILPTAEPTAEDSGTRRWKKPFKEIQNRLWLIFYCYLISNRNRELLPFRCLFSCQRMLYSIHPCVKQMLSWKCSLWTLRSLSSFTGWFNKLDKQSEDFKGCKFTSIIQESQQETGKQQTIIYTWSGRKLNILCASLHFLKSSSRLISACAGGMTTSHMGLRAGSRIWWHHKVDVST